MNNIVLVHFRRESKSINSFIKIETKNEKILNTQQCCVDYLGLVLYGNNYRFLKY